MKDLKSRLTEKELKLDQRSLEKIAKAESEGIIVGKTLELLLSLRSQHELRGFLTEAQRGLVRKIEKDYEDYPLWREACQKLADLYEANKLPSESYGFVESVVAQFNETHSWSVLQKEQIINIIKRHDPGP